MFEMGAPFLIGQSWGRGLRRGAGARSLMWGWRGAGARWTDKVLVNLEQCTL